jgi:hypothetical protein
MTWASPKTLDPVDNRGPALTPWSWSTFWEQPWSMFLS